MRIFTILLTLLRGYWTGKICEAVEALGPVLIKVGQLFSLRPDIIGVELANSLTRLQAGRDGLTGSMGKVTREVLSDGRVVAVKILHSDLRETITKDLKALSIITFPVRFLKPKLKLKAAFDEIRQILLEESDLRYEASHQQLMRKQLAPHGIYVPEVYEVSCDRMVSEWVDGVRMSDFLKMTPEERAEVSNLKPKKISKILIFSLLRQIFEDNKFHGDLHPGNILITRDWVVLIDFGTSSSTEKIFLEDFAEFIEALATQRYTKAADLFSILCKWRTPFTPIGVWFRARRHIKLRANLSKKMQLWATKTFVSSIPYHEKSINACTELLVKEVLRFKGQLQWEWLRINRSMSSLDGTISLLWPGINYQKVARQYLVQSESRLVIPEVDLYETLGRLTPIISRLDERLRRETVFLRLQTLGL